MNRSLFAVLRKLLLIALLVIPNLLMARGPRDTVGTGRRVSFSENRGQWEERVRYRALLSHGVLFVERDCFTLVMQDWGPHGAHHHPAPSDKEHYRQHAYRMHFLGSSAQKVEGIGAATGKENYFLGRDPDRWASGINVYEELLYRDLYPAVDLKVYAAERAMKYDFIVRPGGSVEDIAIAYEGVDGLRLQGGNLIVRTSVGDFVELEPHVYQFIDGKKTIIKARYRLEKERVRFAVDDYDKSLPLVIDPYLYFSSYTGSGADNWGTTACYDSHKNTYTAGMVFAAGYPITLGAYDGTYNGGCDIGIFKFDTSGSVNLFSTYLGGSVADMPHSMYCNTFDELVIFGTTGSDDFPVTPDAFDTSFNGGTPVQYLGSTTINFPNGSDIFVTRFSADGSTLMASTYIGGDKNDGLNYSNYTNYTAIMLGNDSLYYNYGDGARGELVTDDQNNVYVGSTTRSLNFPVTDNCLQHSLEGGLDGVVFKLDYNLRHLLWSTYLGGYKDDAIYSVDCDHEYNVLVCGGTNSLNFPTTGNAYSPYYNGGSADGFVAKISSYGLTLMASTYFGSDAYDQSYFVRCGNNDDVFICGQTKAQGSTLVYNANYNTPNSGQFIAHFKPQLDTLVWSTVFGTGNGEPNISPTAFAADICNRVYVSGWGRIFCGYPLNGQVQPWNADGSGTNGMEITSNAYQTTTDGQDFYIMSMSSDASILKYATFFGEAHNSSGSSSYGGNDHVDGGTSRFDRLGTLYQSVCASCGGNDGFPTTDSAYSTHNNSDNCNNAIFRLSINNDFPIADFMMPEVGCAPFSISFLNTGRGDGFHWDFGDGTSSSQTSPTHTYTSAGLYSVRLIATKTDGCSEADTLERSLLVLGDTTYSLDTLITCPNLPLQIGLSPSPGCTYLWTGGSVSDSTIANPFVMNTGTYTLLVSNGNCTDTILQTVRFGEAQFEIISDTVGCSKPLEILISSQGQNLIYHWSGYRDFSDTLNSDLSVPTLQYVTDSSDWYYIHVVDVLGCEKIDSIFIRFYHILDSVAVVDPLCHNSCEGRATVIPTAEALPPLQYNWGEGWISADSCLGICPGNHTVLFRDANGCRVYQDFSVSNPPLPSVHDSVTHVACTDSCSGSIDIAISGPSVYSFVWLDNGTSDSHRDNLCVGDYILRITDSNGCVYYDTITVRDDTDLELVIADSVNSCSDLCSGKASAIVQGGTYPYNFLWSNGENDSTASALCEGMASVLVTDAEGCSISDSVYIGLHHTLDSVRVWADTNIIFLGESTSLHATLLEGCDYHWEPALYLDDPASSNPTAFPVDSVTQFVVVVTDSAGCTYSDTLSIRCVTVICGTPNLHIPNAFTPNGDGVNDQLCISGEWINEFHIAIFSRWGELVYESDDLHACWDGKYKNNWCMPGVYVYTCDIICSDGQTTQLKGDVTLIR